MCSRGPLFLVTVLVAACGQPAPQQLISSRFPAQAQMVLAGDGFATGGRGFVPQPPSEKDPVAAARMALERRSGLRLELPSAGGEAAVLSSPGFSVEIREKALAAAGVSFGGTVAYSHERGASYWSARQHGFEEWVLVEDAGPGPVAQWEIRGASLRQTAGAVEVLDAHGRPRLRVTAPVAFGPGGVAARAWLTVEGSTLSLFTDARGQALVDPLWTVSGTLSTARSGHTATLLTNGTVLVAGGSDASGGPLATAELYDPATGAWAPTGSLTDARTHHVAVVLGSGRVLVAGGTSSAGALSSAELYNPATGTWSAAGAMSTARASATATVLASGAVLIAGGADGVSVYPGDRYEPTTGAWSSSGSLGAGFTNHSATRLPASGKVLIAGGSRAGTPLTEATLYEPSDDSWTPTGALATARSHHTATLLLSGQVVLIAGGRDGSGPLASAERFDPAGAGTFGPASSLFAARADHTATLLPSGKVIIAGGTGASGDVAPLETYDPAGDTWSHPDALATARSQHTATLLPSGRVLVVGGLSGTTPLSSAERFDDAVPSWSSSASVIAGRRGGTVTLLPTGQVLLTGGIDFAGGYLAHCELYDPTAGTWSTTGTMSGARAYHTASLLNSGKVLVAGGFAGPVNVVATAELFDPGAGTWTRVAPLATARAEHTSTTLSAGQVLVVGGRSSLGTEIATTELYDPASDTWTVSPLNAGRYLHTATLLPSGAVLIVGGGSSSGALGSAERFDPVTLGWALMTPLAEARARHTATLLPNGRVLVTGGDGAAGAALASTELYDPAGGSWVPGGTLATARAAHAATVLPGGLVLLSGGVSGAVPLTSVERFDPENGQVFPAPALPVNRSGHSALLMPSGKVMVVSGSSTVVANLTAVELYDEGRGAPPASVPVFAAVPLPERTPSGPIHLTGAGFTGPTQDSFPLVRVERAGGDAAAYSLGYASSLTSTSALLPALLPGWYWVRVVAAGVPSAARSLFVFPAIILSPASTPPLGSVAFTASGGSGTYTWSLARNPSGGSIDPVSGLYQAGTVGSVTDVVQVTDSSGNFVTADITVGPAVSITPVTVVPRQTVTLAATGGSGVGYLWSILPGGVGGTIDPATGIYTAPPTSGDDVVHVQDSLGNVATATVTVGPVVSVTPSSIDVIPLGTVPFHAAGGTGTGYVWSIETNASGSTIDPSTGAYQAGRVGGVQDVVLVQDPLGNTARANVNVGVAIAVTPANPNVTPKGSITFLASGGAGSGFVWAFSSNASGGTITPDTGAYTAGAIGSVTDVILVTDPAGNTGIATVNVGPAISISPQAVVVPPRGALQVTAAGGLGSGYVWSLCTNASGATIDPGSGAYLAGTTGSVSDVICVSDALGNTASMTQVVGAGVTILGGTATVPLGGSVAFTAAGGSGTGYVWSLRTNGSGGTIDAATGAYKTGLTPDSLDEVQVVDSLGNSATFGFAIGPAVSITAPSGSVPPRSHHTLVAAGGQGSGYVWSLTTNASGATLDATTGAYVAGSTPGVVDQVSVVDPLGNSATATITIGPGVSITPAAVSVAPRQTVNFTASGGAGAGYVWAMATVGAQGTVDATGTFRAGTAGNRVEVVTATDPLGNTASATVTIGPSVTIQASATHTPPRGPLTFSATGGSGTGYVWSFANNGSGGTIDAASGAYKAGSTGDTTDELRVVDSLGNEATIVVQITAGVSIASSPRGLSPGEQFTFVASGGSGEGYVWALETNVSGGSIDPQTGVYTSGPRRNDADVVVVTDSLGNTAHAKVIVWPAWSVAGSGCSSAGGPGPEWLALLGLFLLLARRPVRGGTPRAPHGLLALGLIATTANAQTRDLNTAVVVERFQPAAGAFDLLGVESGQVPRHLGWGLSVHASYANVPLRLVAPGVESVPLIKGQITLNIGATFAVFDRVELSVVAPVTMGQHSQWAENVPDAFQPSIESYGMSDLRITPKVKLFEVGGFFLAVAAPVSLPTGLTSSWLGTGTVTVNPRAIAEMTGLGPVRLLANAGAVIRPARTLIDVDVGNAFTYGAGVEAAFTVGGQRLSALATVVGEYSFISTSAAASPVEALAGLRWRGPFGLGVTLGGGRGLTAGYGTPAYRLFAEVSITPEAPAKRVEAPPEPVATPTAPVEKPVEEKAPAAPEPAPEPEPAVVAPTVHHVEGTIPFAFDRAEVPAGARRFLRKVVAQFNSQPPSVRIRVEGFSDDIGSEDYNRALSVQRAENVRARLIELGVPAARVEAVGHGKNDPVDPRPTPAAKALNRRVEFNFVSP